jgi:rubrerythrin
LKTLEKHFQQQAQKNEIVVKSLQQDVTNASERERASIETYEKRLALLVTKLRESEQELLQNRNSIKNLRKELTIITAFDENN